MQMQCYHNMHIKLVKVE